MDIQRIKNLKDQSKRMDLTLKNLKEAFQALCDITIELTDALNKIQNQYFMDEELFYCNCPILADGKFPCGNCENEREECDESCPYYKVNQKDIQRN